MIIENQKNSTVLSDGPVNSSIAMELDLDSQQMIMKMLSKNLYSDEIGSPVRELVSNALDSHRRADVDKPIIVSLVSTKDNNYEFSVEDFGVGLDTDDVKNIISKYGRSLAREEKNSLGAMGLGFKSPLAYTSSFYFIARKNGVETKWMMYEGEEGNTIDLLYSKSTTELNGVKVIVPVRYNNRGDFVVKMREQLAYFESVYFDIHNGAIRNDFNIFREQDFQFSELSSDNNLHICLDNVYYPIDFSKLGISTINIPIGLRFGLSDGIYPTPNREALRYTSEAKKIILDKIEAVANYLVEKYNSTIVDTTNLKDVFTYYDNNSRRVALLNKNCEINSIMSYASIKMKEPKLIGVDLLNLKELCENKNRLLCEYKIRYTLKHRKMSELGLAGTSLSLKETNIPEHIYVFNEKIGGKKRDYFRSMLIPNDTYYFVRKRYSIKLGNISADRYSILQEQETYSHLLHLKHVPKDEWRKMIKEYQFIQNMYVSQFIDVDKFQIPQDWIDARKKEKILAVSETRGAKRVKLQGDVCGKEGKALERYISGKNCKWVPSVWSLQTMHQYPGLTVYTNYEDADKLDSLYHIALGTIKMRFITFSPREIRVLEKVKIHNLISYEEFMKGDTKPFKKLVTAYLIHGLIEENSYTFRYREELRTISTSLSEKLDALKQYDNSYHRGYDDYIYKIMLQVAEEHNLFDLEIYSTYQEVKALVEKLPFIETVTETMAGGNGSYSSVSPSKKEALVEVLRDLFKYYKYRIDYTNYKITLNDNSWMNDMLGTTPLTEEVIEEIEDSI